MDVSTLEVQACNEALLKARVSAWVAEQMDMDQLGRDARGTMAYLKSDTDNAVEGCYSAWCKTLVSSSFGRYSEVAFLHDVLWSDASWEDVNPLVDDVDAMEIIQSQGGLFDAIVSFATEQLQALKPNDLPGEFFVGWHEADGSLGIFYSETEDN